MSNFKILEVTKESKDEYVDAIAVLEEKVLQDMENKGKIGQLFITGKEDIEQYAESEYNTVIIAINEERKLKAAAYITQNQKPFTYNDITKYFKYGEEYKQYVKSLYKNKTEYIKNMLTAYDIKIKAYKYATNKILEEYPQYNTITEFLENELEDKQNKFHEKSILRELINKYMSEYIENELPQYKRLYEQFYWINAEDIQIEMQKNMNMNNLKNDTVTEYETFINGEESREHTQILQKGKLKIYQGCKNMKKYYTANTENSVEIDTYITDPENRQNGLAKILVYEGIRKHIERHFKNPNNDEIFLCSTLHKKNLSSKYVSEFFGLKDTIFVNRRQGRDREVHICKLQREEASKYLEDISKKIAVLYGYNPNKKMITKEETIQILKEQIQYEKEEMQRLKRSQRRKKKKFKSIKEMLKNKRNKVDKLKDRIKEEKRTQYEEENDR